MMIFNSFIQNYDKVEHVLGKLNFDLGIIDNYFIFGHSIKIILLEFDGKILITITYI